MIVAFATNDDVGKADNDDTAGAVMMIAAMPQMMSLSQAINVEF